MSICLAVLDCTWLDDCRTRLFFVIVGLFYHFEAGVRIVSVTIKTLILLLRAFHGFLKGAQIFD